MVRAMFQSSYWRRPAQAQEKPGQVFLLRSGPVREIAAMRFSNPCHGFPPELFLRFPAATDRCRVPLGIRR